MPTGFTEAEATSLPEPYGAASIWHDSEPRGENEWLEAFRDRLGRHGGRDWWAEDAWSSKARALPIEVSTSSGRPADALPRRDERQSP